MLTQEKLKEYVTYDPESGIFRMAKRRRRTTRQIGDVLGSKTKAGYFETCIEQKRYYLHRLAFLYMTGEMPSGIVDHINRDKSDNTWTNLRIVTHTENLQNDIAPRKHGSLGVRGVYRYKDRFRAKINANKKQIHLGEFATIEEASSAYAAAKQIYHPQILRSSI